SADRVESCTGSYVCCARNRADQQADHRLLAAAGSEDVPDVPARPGARTALTAVAIPSGPAGDRLFELAKQALPDTPLVRALSFDDIVLHREITNVSLADLPPFSPAGREAYQKLLD